MFGSLEVETRNKVDVMMIATGREGRGGELVGIYKSEGRVEQDCGTPRKQDGWMDGMDDQ
jgi:hypothetical protein